MVFDTILRPSEVLALPGGKGFNVARAARLLGADVMTAGVAGGHAGRWLFAQLEREGLRPHSVPSEVEARTAYVVAGEDGRSVMVYEPGEPQPQRAFDDLLGLIRDELLRQCKYVVMSGSVPPGVDPTWMGRVVKAAADAGVPCLVDARGPSFHAALSARPDVLKANESEIAEAGLGPVHARSVALARAAVRAGAKTSVVTRASRGAVACSGDTSWSVSVPVQRALNAVGAGDAFTAGLVVALTRGQPLEVALAEAGAAAAASVLELGAGQLNPARVAALRPQVRVRKLAA